MIIYGALFWKPSSSEARSVFSFEGLFRSGRRLQVHYEGTLRSVRCEQFDFLARLVPEKFIYAYADFSTFSCKNEVSTLSKILLGAHRPAVRGCNSRTPPATVEDVIRNGTHN